MPFTVREFRDLIKILEEKPEWRAELRRLVLTEELLSLPEQLATLAVVAGRRITSDASRRAREMRVWQVTDGMARRPD